MNQFAMKNLLLPRTQKHGSFLPLNIRCMSALKAISQHLKSVKNIQKITKSMKMVSTSKYSRAYRDLMGARPYGEGSKLFFQKSEVDPPTEGPLRMLILITSDKGLCGGCHAGIARHVRKELQDTEPDPSKLKIICVGDKSRSLLRLYFPKNIAMVFSDIGRKQPTFLDASFMGQNIWKSRLNYTHGSIIYNKFKSIVSYTINVQPLYSINTVMDSPKFLTYDDIDTDMMESYMEFSLVSLLFYALVEGACSEQSSRMTAMDNASKNAGEMIDKLSLAYNRTRQAVITRELIEIISGAAALKS